jgi:thiol-disulfide isomerase/thioredoxin
MTPGVSVILSKPNSHSAARRWIILCLIGAALGVGILNPRAPQVPGLQTANAEALVRGEIQHFRLARNPQPAPGVTFHDARGRVIDLAKFRGKVVLVNFWATWCAPCRREMPDLDQLQRTLGGKRFEVVALSLDRAGMEAVVPFYEEIGIKSLAVYLDPLGRVQRAFAITRFPTTVLIDAHGFEVGSIEGPAQWMAPEARALMRFFMEKPYEVNARSR